MKTQAALAITAALALAACQQAGDAGSETAGTADAGAAGESSASASADSSGDIVEARLRGGLWQTTASFPDGGASVTSRVCMDGAMSPLDTGAAQSQQAEDCTQTTTRTPDGFAFTSRCEIQGGGVTETVGNLTGDFETAYRMEATVTTTNSPMAAMNGSARVVTSAERQGDCPAGWRPGDVEIPGLGARININDMRRQAEAQTAP